MLVYLPTSIASGRHPSLEPAITLITHADFLEVTYMYILYINYDYIIYYILYYHNHYIKFHNIILQNDIVCKMYTLYRYIYTGIYRIISGEEVL